MADRSSSGMSVFEVIVAVGVLMFVAPIVLRFGIRQLDDTRYLGLSKQMRQVEKALMNFAAAVKQDVPKDRFSEIRVKAREFLEERYGLDSTVQPDLTDGMLLSYRKSKDGAVEVFALFDLSKYALGEAGLKQVLMYAGGTAGYVEDGSVYSITGAWSADLADLTGLRFDETGNLAVIKVDDSDLDRGYTSSLYLYRNSLGGTDGSKMLVPLSIGGHSIRNLGNLFVREFEARTVKFNEGLIEGALEIKNGFNVGGRFSFVDKSHVNARHLYLHKENYLNNFVFPEGYLYIQEGNARADISVEDVAQIANISVAGINAGRMADSAISIEGPGEASLVAEFGYVVAQEVVSRITSVQKGMIKSQSMNTAGGMLNLNAGMELRLYNIRTNPASPMSGGLKVNDLRDRFRNASQKLLDEIREICFLEGVLCKSWGI
ncbi:MAG: hypothetical protein LBT92_02745 [Rickettsiales bacterium]|nr:hypothetical protein [Rickettsiales bacterium]